MTDSFTAGFGSGFATAVVVTQLFANLPALWFTRPEVGGSSQIGLLLAVGLGPVFALSNASTARMLGCKSPKLFCFASAAGAAAADGLLISLAPRLYGQRDMSLVGAVLLLGLGSVGLSVQYLVRD